MRSALTVVAMAACTTAYTLPGRTPAPRLGVRAARPALIAEADVSSWAEDVESAEKPTVVFFYSPWCRACKAALPKLQRVERKYADKVSFYQVNFKSEAALCYRERVFNFPTVHFYLPGIGRVAGGELLAAGAEQKVASELDRLIGRRELYERTSAAAIGPVVQYSELVGALQGLAEVSDRPPPRLSHRTPACAQQAPAPKRVKESTLSRPHTLLQLRCFCASTHDSPLTSSRAAQMTDSRREMDERLAERRRETEARIKRMAAEYGLVVSVARDAAFVPDPSVLVDSKDSARVGSLLVNPKEEAARLRSLVRNDASFVAELEHLFASLDTDADGLVRLGSASEGGIEAAVAALQPQQGTDVGAAASGLRERLTSSLSSVAADEGGEAASAVSMSLNRSAFVSLMIDKTVRDFAAGGERALRPAFQAIDARGEGAVTQAQLIETIDHFCSARPETAGCGVDGLPLRLAAAFKAFANAESGVLDYDGFVEMVSCRGSSAAAAAAAAAATTQPLRPALEVLAPADAAQPAAVQTIVRVVPAEAATPPPPPPPAELRLQMRCLHEAVGTAMIVTGGSAGVAALLGPTLTAGVWACAVAMAVATFSGSSGAHFNPAVTMALVYTGDHPLRDAPAYLLAQLLGAVAASTAVVKLAEKAVTMPAAAAAFPAEVLLTGLLVFCCFTFGDLVKQEVIRPGAVPLLVGCVIFSINIFFGQFGAVINPAMAIAPRIVAATAGWGAPALAGALSYIGGALVGGVLGAKLFLMFIGNRAYNRACSWMCAEGPTPIGPK